MTSEKGQPGARFRRRQRSWNRFKRNRRGYYSLWIFLTIFTVSMFAELICNDVPLLVKYDDHYFFPVMKFYSETTFGGDFETETDYKDPLFQERMEEKGNYAFFPPVRHNYNSINFDIDGPVPSPPTADNLLGTDDRGRDVLARIVYGFRLSVLFGLALTAMGTVAGIIAGAIQGFSGGRVDLMFQRFIEIWGAMPELYLLIIFASIFQPSVLLLFLLLSLFSWMGLSDYVRAEFLRGRNMEYVKAARALGVGSITIMWRHLLPNSMTPVITFLPFRVSAAILALTSLDFLGLGVPPSTPSLGELLAQGKANIDAWWLSLSSFSILVLTLVLLIFIGEALRDTYDPRKK
ncbi:MAG: ABC transporter permease [Deltaproteobacteria bacterium]|nr:ABC transporter permease [Deltaproteobacteria bacterium]